MISADRFAIDKRKEEELEEGVITQRHKDEVVKAVTG
jgi:hypothetical protein